MSELLASVVVAVRNDERVRRLLASLIQQTMAANRYEVIVVENGSKELSDVDGLAGVVRYLHLSEANAAAARNTGLTAARGRYLLLTDADCVADTGWVAALCGALATTGATAVGGTIRKYRPVTWVQRYAVTVVNGQAALSYLPALHLPYVAGANAGFDAAALRAVGGFDNELRSGNDVDVCYKVGLHGGTVTVAPAAVVWHEDRATLAAHFRRFRFYAVFQVLLFAKYKHVSGKRLVLDRYPLTRTAQALGALPRALAGLLRRDAAPALTALLQVVEAAGVFVGEIEGAVRFRQLYI
jgi:glycosyltransferase involved in cell wall biosynthesis